ncbi:PDZ domain-containing protein [Bremerella cremea]|uniref:PDZ domain-containing protein n=1 Tax=Bremerella cremea TaxID=1031537 RepID=A0A368KR62_9BACT|nr:aspartyl protease family protein [Bremerella cremea]RCS49365.1 PDZ domain-containing protein [Bremerella cremea]
MSSKSIPIFIALGLLVLVTNPRNLSAQPNQASLPYFHGDRIFVEGAVNGKQIRMLLDTGATHSALFLPAAKQLGVLGDKPMLAGTPPLPWTEEFQIAMFGEQAKMRMPVLDFSPQEPIAGVFSWTNLGASLLLIDGYQRVVAPLTTIPQNDRWQKWKMQEGSGQLFFEVTQNQKPLGRVFLDTGAVFGLRVQPALWKKWREKNPDAGLTLETFRYGLGKTTVHEMAWAKEFHLGDLVFYDVAVSPFSEEEVKIGGDDFVAAIGIQALRNMRVLVDRETNSVYTESIAPAHIQNRLGAVFVADEDQQGKLIAHVLKGTPADAAGIKKGDILIAVEGLDSLDEGAVNHQFFQPAGTRLKLKLQQAGEVKEVEVELKDLLP